MTGTDVTARYRALLDRRAQLDGAAGFEPLWMPGFLFPPQAHLVDWAIRQGRGALLEDCGLGKSPQELVWAQNVHQHTGRPVLLLTPLGVTSQMTGEAAKFGVEAAVSRRGRGLPVGRCRVGGSAARLPQARGQPRPGDPPARFHRVPRRGAAAR